MSVVTVRPNSSSSGPSPTIEGGSGSIHAALADDSDSTRLLVTPETYAIINLGFPDPTIPAGAAIRRATLRVRTSLFTFTWTGFGAIYDAVVAGVPAANLGISWVQATTVPMVVPDIDELPDVLSASLKQGGGTNASVFFYAAYLDVLYVAKPVVDVTAPTGTISVDNRPTVTWADTLDPDGGGQYRYQVKIFNDAQYGAGGFNPSSSTPFSESGIVDSSSTSWSDTDPLPDDNYRAYVRVAQRVNGDPHWSDWDYIGFVVDVPNPAVPLDVTVTAEASEGRLRIDVDCDPAGDGDNDRVEIERSLDGGETWESLRTELGDGHVDVVADAAVAWDYEVPNGATATYRARALSDLDGETWVASPWLSGASGSWSSGVAWLKHPTQPDLNRAVTIVSYPSVKKAGATAVFKVLGSSLGVSVSDSRGFGTGSLTLLAETDLEQEAIDELLDSGAALLLQTAEGQKWPDRWLAFTDTDRELAVDKAWIEDTLEGLAWAEVRSPAGNITWPEEGS